MCESHGDGEAEAGVTSERLGRPAPVSGGRISPPHWLTSVHAFFHDWSTHSNCRDQRRLDSCQLILLTVRGATCARAEESHLPLWV